MLTKEQRALLEYWTREAGTDGDRDAIRAALADLDAQREEIDRIRVLAIEGTRQQETQRDRIEFLECECAALRAEMDRTLVTMRTQREEIARLTLRIEAMQMDASARIMQGDAMRDRIAALEAERDALREVLRGIAEDPHCIYKGDGDSYSTGVVDGHRCAAQKAKDALRSAKPGKKGA